MWKKPKPLSRGPVLLKKSEPSLRGEGINTHTHPVWVSSPVPTLRESPYSMEPPKGSLLGMFVYICVGLVLTLLFLANQSQDWNKLSRPQVLKSFVEAEAGYVIAPKGQGHIYEVYLSWSNLAAWGAGVKIQKIAINCYTLCYSLSYLVFKKKILQGLSRMFGSPWDARPLNI